MHFRPLQTALALAAACGAAGCATLASSRDISVGVVNLLPTSASLFETSVALTLRFTNETARPLALSGSSHRLYLDGTFVGRAVSPKPLSLGPLATTTQTVTLYLENLTLLRKFTQMSNRASPVIGYRLESRLHPAGGERSGTLDTVSTGELDLGALERGWDAPPPTAH